jgi:acetyl esterase/lipase
MAAPHFDRRRFFRDGAYLAAAGSLLAGAASGDETAAVSAPFANLKPQSPINIRADAYGQTALNLSRLAAMTTRCRLDIAYGSGAAQRLDVYMPADKSARGLPVFMNIHGGGWTHGYKEWMGLNAPVITQFPAVYVSIEYGLSPTQRHPKLLHDCLQAVAWVYKNIASFGGDPRRLFIGGHSAGAHLSALTTVRRDLYAQYGLPQDVIKACLPYSGVYDFRDMVMYGQPATGGPAENLFSQESDKIDASPMAFLRGLETPFFVVWSENDNVLCRAQSPPFVLALREHGVRADGYMFPLFDHFWIHIDQQNPANLWTRTLRNWMAGDPRTAAVG